MTEPQSVQGYIDQTPSWPDGTATPTVITWWFRIETAGVDLEAIGK